MSTCSCGGVSIDCPGGCGCLCASDEPGDCVRWCEPSDPIFVVAEDKSARRGGGLVRITKRADGSERMRINAQASDPDDDAPRYPPTTTLAGCLRGATLQSLALVLDVLHTSSVRAPAERAEETIDEAVSGTLEQLAEKHGLIVK